jgi:hypothetical protein
MTQTRLQNRQYRLAMSRMLQDMDAGYFVTANFNRCTNITAARNALKAWHARMDKALLGGSWSRKCDAERTFFIGFAEHFDSNLHWHLMLRLGDKADRRVFEQKAATCWDKLVTSGCMDVKKIDTCDDTRRIANYVTKDLWHDEARNGFVVSTEFKT